MHQITFGVSRSYYLDGLKLDEWKSHEPCIWWRHGTVPAICCGKKSTGWPKVVYKSYYINDRQQRTKRFVTIISNKSLSKGFVPVMMISIVSNNECCDHDANNYTNSAYKLNISMLSVI